MSEYTDVVLPYTDLLSAIVPVSSSVRPSVQRDVRLYRRCLTLHRSSFSHRSCITVCPSVVMSDYTDVVLPYTDLLSAIVLVSPSVRPS